MPRISHEYGSGQTGNGSGSSTSPEPIPISYTRRNTAYQGKTANKEPNQSARSSSRPQVQTAPSQGRRKKNEPLHLRDHIQPVLRDIIRLQQGTNLLIPKASLSRVIREVLEAEMRSNNMEGLRITMQALNAIHESLEAYMVQFFEDANKCTIHRQRATLSVADMQLTRYMRGRLDAGNR